MNKKKITLIGTLSFIIILLIDYILQQLILKNIVLIPNILTFNYTENFSLNMSTVIINSILMCLVIGLIIYFTKKESKSVIPLYIILAGGIGNLLDKFVKGYVIDYIKLFNNPEINLSDVAITVGLIVLIICMFKYLINKKRKKIQDE